MKYWLMKSEGDCYSIEDLKEDRATEWSGVRNYQARNFMMKDMEIGDSVLFYHSNGSPSGIYGLARVASAAHPDSSQFDPQHEHYDPLSSPDNPRWWCVDVEYISTLPTPISLQELKMDNNTSGMLVCQKGSRLSIQPVSERHFNYINALSGASC
jgi:predicted RNA-binding protein with PUA-like domain